MKWIPKNGSWWRKAVLKAGGDADRIRIRPEEQNAELAHLRMHKAIAATEIAKCTALLKVAKIIH